jgi:hypothetical protein
MISSCFAPLSQYFTPSFQNAPLAQLAEQVTLNHWVVGSIPTRCTLKIKDLQNEHEAECYGECYGLA